jgi:tetratricopeptide (TPR) repeat protein
MKRLLLSAILLASGAAAARAQDDFDLASALAERGWDDLSEEIFQRITQNGSLTPEQKAEGRYGLARLKIQMAERSDSLEEKQKLLEKAIKDVDQFLKDFPNHPRRGEALSDIGYLYQTKGKSLMAAAKTDPAKADEAEKAFASAEKLFLDLIAQLKKSPVAMPENPDKDPKGMAAFEAWEEKIMFAKYNYGTALFSHAETYRDNPAKHPDMKKLLLAMIKFFNDDFMWEYERYLLAFDASIYMGRGYQILAETSEREKTEDYWKQAFMNVGRAKSLLSDKANRGNDAVRDIAARAILFEMKARVAYADVKRGQTAVREYGTAAKLAEDFFKMFPNARFEEMGKALQLEQARVYCKGGQVKKGVDLLKQLAAQYKESWVENVAIDIMGEYGADQSPGLAYDAGINFKERGPAYMYKAIQKFRKAILAARKPEDQKYVPLCWYEIGLCYYYLGRHHEAVAALTPFEQVPLKGSSEAPQAALLKLSALGKLAKLTKSKTDEKALEDFRTWVTKTYPAQAGAQLIRQAAIDAEGKQQWGEAVAKWEQIAKPGTEIYEECVFSLGLASYNHGLQLFGQARQQRIAAEKSKLESQGVAAWQKAADAFGKHLALVEKSANKDPRVMKNAVGSVLFSAKMLLGERLNKPEEALKLSENLDKRFPNGDPRFLIAIMALRIDAKLQKGAVEEAEEDLKSLKAKYDKEGVGLDHYSRALTLMANAFTQTAVKFKDSDPEKYDLFSMKSADFYYQFYQLNPDAVQGKLDQMEGMAQMLFIAAEQRMKTGEAKNDKDMIAEAREIYGRSRDLYSEVLLRKEADLLKAGKTAEIRGLKARITRCFLMTGQFQKAVELYEEITRNDPQMSDGSSWESLSDCYVEQARSMPAGPGRIELLKKADKTYATLAAMLMQQNAYNEHTWRLLYKHSQCLFEIDPDKLHGFLENMRVRGFAPKWDADDQGVSRWGFQSKFEEIRRQLAEKLPGRK